MSDKFIDRLINFSIVLVNVVIGFYSVILLIFLISKWVAPIAKDSIVSDFMSIDYFQFLKVGFFCLFFCLLVSSIMIGLYSRLFGFSKNIETIFQLCTKLSCSISIIVPLMFVLTKEQFNVVTTFVSFLALFSFVIPKDFFKSKPKDFIN